LIDVILLIGYSTGMSQSEMTDEDFGLDPRFGHAMAFFPARKGLAAPGKHMSLETAAIECLGELR
jgi:hypothetical protein